jgi:hypothetical protein
LALNNCAHLRLYRIAAAAAAILHFSLAACAFSQPDYAQQKTSDVSFVTLDRGFTSGIRERKLLVIKTEKEWKDLWQTHVSISSPPKAVPVVDFDKEMIVVAFSGEKPSGGHRMEIFKIEEDTGKRELRVIFRETKPPSGAMVTAALTQPYHIVKLKKTDLSVTFDSQQ